jgi:hypothetical protein
MPLANPLNFNKNTSRGLSVRQTGNPTVNSQLAGLQPTPSQALRKPGTNLIEPAAGLNKTGGFVNNIIKAVGNSWRFAVDPQRETNRYVEGALDHLQDSGSLNKIVRNVSSEAGKSAISAGLSKLKEKVDSGVNNVMSYVAEGGDKVHPVVGNFVRQHPYLSAGGLAVGTGAALYNMPRILSALSRLHSGSDEEEQQSPKLKLEGSSSVRKRIQEFRERLRRRRR